MKRLIKKIAVSFYNVGEKVRFYNDTSRGFYTVINVDLRDNTYTLQNDQETIEGINFSDIVSEDEFIVGDQVLFKNHPYTDTVVFEVKEVLSDGTYFIESEDYAFTGINGKNLELIM